MGDQSQVRRAPTGRYRRMRNGLSSSSHGSPGGRSSSCSRLALNSPCMISAAPWPQCTQLRRAGPGEARSWDRSPREASRPSAVLQTKPVSKSMGKVLPLALSRLMT